MNPSSANEDTEIINLSISPRRERGQYHAHGTARFPIAEIKTLRFASGGVHCSGVFEVSQSGDPGADELVVDIDAFFRAEDALNEMLVCRLHPARGEYGVGIYVSIVILFRICIMSISDLMISITHSDGKHGGQFRPEQGRSLPCAPPSSRSR